MEWILALIVAAIPAVLLWRQRLRRLRELREVCLALEPLTGRTEPLSKPSGEKDSLTAIRTAIGHIRDRVDAIRRDRTTEAANLQTILSSMAEGVMMVDSRHVIRLANPSLRRILELKSDPSGQTVLRALRDVHFEEIVSTTLASGGTRHTDVTIATRPPRHLSLAATAIQEASGEKAVLVICHDVTRLRQLEDVRREFVANVSHELRTPLAIFQGYLENLLDNPGMPRPELVEILEILKKHSTRLNALVEDLLVIARLESRTEKLRLEPIDPRALIEDVAADWNARAARKHISISTQCAPDAPAFEADAFRIEQVLTNLLDNALKYTEPGGKVSLTATTASGGIQFAVEDNGIGVTPQDLPHIFERFYRADKARSREQGGTGLGLSIVKHIVHLHGGSVQAQSTYGKGTRILIHLPLQPPSASQPRRETKPVVDAAQNQPEPHLVP
jgi:two-component system phosphate regulon sensor histidine kinase PhoR